MSQPELSFDTPAPANGYERWQEERRAAKVELGKRLGLPLGHQVEVWLRGNVRLRGRLELVEEKLFLPEDNDAHLTWPSDARSSRRVKSSPACGRIENAQPRAYSVASFRDSAQSDPQSD